MIEHPQQAAFVTIEHAREKSLADDIPAVMLFLVVRFEQMRGHHRRRGERNDQRHEHRRRQRDRELAEQAADDSRHQQNRDEHRDQRDADRDDGETDAGGALDRGFERRHPLLAIARNVLDDDDRVVNHEAGANRQRHQRQIVEAVAEQVHDAEGADQRQRNDDARNQRRAQITQEQEHHHDHQRDRDQHRELDVVDRRADGGGAVHARR